MRVLYLVFFGAIGIFFTYVNVYYKSLGLSGTQIGLINTVAPLAAILGMTVWGVLNDRLGATRRLLLIAVLGGIVLSLTLSAVRAYALIIAVACTYSFFISPVMPLLDTTTLSLLRGLKEHYGRQRLWGSVGFMVTTATVGFILQRTGVGGMFVCYALVMCVVLLIATQLPSLRVKLGGFSLRGLNQMLGQPAWLVFTASVFLFGLSLSGIFSFLSVTLSAMGGSDSLIGISWTLSALSELPVMLFSAAFLRRIGAERMVALAFFLYIVRNLAFAVMPSAVWALPLQLAFGGAYGLYWIGAVNYISDIAPANIRTTAQGLLMSTTTMASVVGAFLAGSLYDRLGPAGMYHVMSVFSMLALLLFVAGRVALKKRAPAVAATE